MHRHRFGCVTSQIGAGRGLRRIVGVAAALIALAVSGESLLAWPSSPPQGKFFVNETVTAAVSTQYVQKGASQGIIIYQHDGIDLNNDAFLDERAFRDAIRRMVPTTYTGPVCLDWEGRAMDYLVGPTTPVLFSRTVAEYVKAAEIFKSMRPSAKVGFYGLPARPYHVQDELAVHQRAMALKPIINKVDHVYPSVYSMYALGEQFFLPSENIEYVRDTVALALELADGKPVFAYVWPRYFDGNPNVGLKLIPATDFQNHVKEVFNVSHNGKRATGLVWWGADPYWRFLSKQNYAPTHPLYVLSQRAKAVFAVEIQPNETDSQHFTKIHKITLTQLASVIQNAPQ